MKNLKKNNKGFSLVELIVVVLIMAIIAVALAPQVLRWVNNARISNDLQVLGTMMTAADAALATEKGYNDVKEKDSFSVKLGKTGGYVYSDTSKTNFKDVFEKNCGDASNLKIKQGEAVVVIKKGVLQPRSATSTGGSYYKADDGSVYTDSSIN